MLVRTFKGACVPLPQGTAVQWANGDDGAIWRSGELFIATGAVMRLNVLSGYWSHIITLQWARKSPEWHVSMFEPVYGLSKSDLKLCLCRKSVSNVCISIETHL